MIGTFILLAAGRRIPPGDRTIFVGNTLIIEHLGSGGGGGWGAGGNVWRMGGEGIVASSLRKKRHRGKK